MNKPRRVRRKILKGGKIKKEKKIKEEPKVKKDERKDIYMRIMQMHPEKKEKDSLFVLAITRRRTNHLIVRT